MRSGIAIGDAAVGEKKSLSLVNEAVANGLGSKRVTAALPCAKWCYPLFTASNVHVGGAS